VAQTRAETAIEMLTARRKRARGMGALLFDAVYLQ
jgi:hypothetical protein